jgi:taurine dioxygenase
MTYRTAPLSPDLRFGKSVRGLRLEDLADTATREALKRAWFEAGLLVFGDCEMTEAFHLELSRVFGPLDVHKTREYLDARHPELVTLVSSGETVLEIDGELGEYQSWHKDLIYTETMNRGGVLRALKPTARGGLTGFIDLVDAYRRLPGALQARIADLRVVYQICLHEHQCYAARGPVRLVRKSPALERLEARRDEDFPPVSHPLVFTLPETGEKVLNLSLFHARHVEGMPQADSHALLSELADHVFDSPAYHHRWSERELVLWDNWRMTHMVSLIPADEPRVMQRTTIGGDYGLGRPARTT